MKKYENDIFLAPIYENGDGVKLFGSDNPNIVENCIIDFSSPGIDILDENISFIDGCIAEVRNTIIAGGIKGALCGNGDHPENDKNAKILFENCIFFENGRRNPDVQHGVEVFMNECLIIGWSNNNRFDIRSFGAYSRSGAKLYIENSIFLQNKFFKLTPTNFIKDIVNHVGNDFNTKSLSWLSFLPGSCKGAYASKDGNIELKNCYKNKKWIYLQNCESYMQEDEAVDIIFKTSRLCNIPNIINMLTNNGYF